MHIGIDYGSKLAGTTALAYKKDDQLIILQSQKNKDADVFILQHLSSLDVQSVFLDAPLSLPASYYGKGNDYFYRLCDRELKAMSPMFLGGLTARAMKLKSQLVKLNIQVYETYPKALILQSPILKELYLKKNLKGLESFIQALGKIFPLELPTLKNWHQVDALIAWWSGYRDQNKKSIKSGNPEEGLIIY